MSSADINAINQVLGNIQSQINEVTGNTLSSYNQLSRIVAQQSNIYNTIYYGLGNLNTGNLTVNSSYTINGNLTYENLNFTGNLALNNGNLLLPNGNILSTIGNIVMNNGNIGITRGNLILSNGNILSTVGNIVINNGNIGITRGNLILSNGNIGIKRTNPQYELDINGSANISGNILMSGMSFLSGSDLTYPFKIVTGSGILGSVGTGFGTKSNIPLGYTFSSTPTIILQSMISSARIIYSISSANVSHIVTLNTNNVGASAVDGYIDFIAIGSI